MARERFDWSSFKAEGLAQVKQANEFIAEYERQGLVLTVRQLYYRFVAKDLIPNTFRSYKNFSNMIDMGRKRGLIDWSAIEDRTRNLAPPLAFTDAGHLMQNAPNWYKENPWLEQKYRPENWVEKEAQIGVVEKASYEMRAPYLACRGYLSQSEAYAAGKRFAKYRRDGYDPVVFYIGDHDPSGVDMSRDNFARVSMYAGFNVEFVRLALNMDQIELYDPPPQPVKDRDSRADGYKDIHGESSWELDALEPQIIIDLIQNALRERIDQSAWDATMAREAVERAKLQVVADYWDTALDAAEEERDRDEG